MKAYSTSMPKESLANNYLPADFTDTFACKTQMKKEIKPNDLLVCFWKYSPGWVSAMFKLRNLLVKPFGLHTNNKENKKAFEESLENKQSTPFSSVIAETDQESILCLDDKHLKAYLSFYIKPSGEKEQEIYAITVVHYHNWLGKAYFFVIRPFHKIIVMKMMEYIIEKLNNGTINLADRQNEE